MKSSAAVLMVKSKWMAKAGISNQKGFNHVIQGSFIS